MKVKLLDGSKCFPINYKLEYRPGTSHSNADRLSKIPCDPETCQCYNGVTILEQLPCGGCQSCQKKNERSAILEETDDVRPLASKRVELRDYTYVVYYLYISLFGCLCIFKLKLFQMWNVSESHMSNTVAEPGYIHSVIFKAKRSTVLLSERSRATFLWLCG